MTEHWDRSLKLVMAAGWPVRLRCCRLQLLTFPPPPPPEPWRISIPPTCRRLIGWVCTNEPYMTKGSWGQLKAFTSPRPSPALEVLSTLTACYRRRASLPVGNYPPVFLCFITNSWPPQDVQRKWGIWICLLIRAGEHLCTNTVVICLATRARNTRTQWVPTHTSLHYCIHSVGTKTNTTHMHHTNTLCFEQGRHLLARIKHTYHKHLLP